MRISESGIESSKQNESESFPNIVIDERNKTKTYAQHFYFDTNSLNKFRHASHNICIKLDPENQSILKFWFDIQNIQSQLMESSERLGHIGTAENMQ